jgi:hypothetical protein
MKREDYYTAREMIAEIERAEAVIKVATHPDCDVTCFQIAFATPEGVRQLNINNTDALGFIMEKTKEFFISELQTLNAAFETI